ncbi:hypothetical protein DAEQUDRAFT_720469 [Daedalea quercina L-15889]|uniref:Uncharacterized protein n=1 Tax=Daedalea quercina L-15889 TaxID=1314783 RepID=A0A165U2K5_9APHY|nr:hypothetical protein DAEQUDRAFT_720469 [Daedalea quercina L-15889]
MCLYSHDDDGPGDGPLVYPLYSYYVHALVLLSLPRSYRIFICPLFDSRLSSTHTPAWFLPGSCPLFVRLAFPIGVPSRITPSSDLQSDTQATRWYVRTYVIMC